DQASDQGVARFDRAVRHEIVEQRERRAGQDEWDESENCGTCKRTLPGESEGYTDKVRGDRKARADENRPEGECCAIDEDALRQGTRARNPPNRVERAFYREHHEESGDREHRRAESGQPPSLTRELFDVSGDDLARFLGQHVREQEGMDVLPQPRKNRERRHERERESDEGHERKQGRESEARGDLQTAILVEPLEHVREEAAELSQRKGHGIPESERERLL